VLLVLSDRLALLVVLARLVLTDRLEDQVLKDPRVRPEHLELQDHQALRDPLVTLVTKAARDCQERAEDQVLPGLQDL